MPCRAVPCCAVLFCAAHMPCRCRCWCQDFPIPTELFHLNRPDCFRSNEPLTVNATSFTAGDVIVVSWNFTRTTVNSTDQIQASGPCFPCPALQLSLFVLQNASRKFPVYTGKQMGGCIPSVLSAAVHCTPQHHPGHCPNHAQPDQVQVSRRQHFRQRHVS